MAEGSSKKARTYSRYNGLAFTKWHNRETYGGSGTIYLFTAELGINHGYAWGVSVPDQGGVVVLEQVRLL